MPDDVELQLFRRSVNCAAVLEGMVGGWKLDVRESTRRALKYRRGKGEVLIITHDGRGWWDPLSQAKGDIFDLVQYLDRGLNFGQVRQVLRRFVGVVPIYPTAIRAKQGRGPNRPLQERWAKRPCLRPDSPAWAYLADAVCARPGKEDVRRVAITEGPTDALSLAVLEGSRPDTLYVATGGGMGPGTLGTLQTILARLATVPDALVASAADANAAGDRYAERHAELAADAGVSFERRRPSEGLDFNDVLKQGRGT